jgi:hypothetical protein
MSNLLKDASILLTPTGYDNGSMNAIKPENGDGDMTFSRNSAATRVNAQGLVENVQILSSNLVSNGNFSQEGAQDVSNGSFSQEGSELVVNGDFATDSDWTKSTGITIGGSVCSFTSTPSIGSVRQSIPATTVGTIFKVKYEVLSLSEGAFNVTMNGRVNQGINATTVGIHIDYIVAPSLSSTTFGIHAVGTTTGSIDNVSVVEVGQDWTLGTGWSIGEDEATYDGLSGTQQIASSGTSVSPQVGKTYKVSFDVLTQGSGTNSAFFGGVNFSSTNLAVGSYVFYVTATTPYRKFGIFGRNGSVFSITNISVKEVGQNWTLGGSGSNTASIGGNSATITSVDGNSYIQQNSVLTSGKSYKISYEILSSSGSSVLKMISSLGLATVPTTVGTHIVYGTAVSTTFYIERVANGMNATITNISVLEITDDTNLPRINYGGFSYQDSLGSEEVTNGDFATDTDWNKTQATISNGEVNISSDGSYAAIDQGNVSVIGKTYFYSIDVKSIIGTLQFRLGSGTDVEITTTGVKTGYINATSTTLEVKRKSGAGVIDARIDNVSVKEVLGQEVVPDSGCGSWLLEPQSTNLITQSELFSDASWTNSGLTLNSNQAISPDGTNNASEIIGTGYLQQAISLTALSDYTFSLFWKKNTSNKVKFLVSSSGIDEILEIDTNTLSVLSQVGIYNYSIDNYGNGWYRMSMIWNENNTEVSGIRILADTTDALSSLYIYGAQLEQNSYATSLIPTQGAISTRLADIANNSGNASLINSEEGTLYFEGSALADDGTSRRISISDGTNTNRIFLSYGTTSNNIRAYIVAGGVNVTDRNYTGATITNSNKIAIRWGVNNFSLWVNGLNVSEDLSGATFTSSVLNDLSFNGAAGGSPFFGENKALAVYKTALTDAGLRSLTYPPAVATTFDLDFDTIAEQFTFTRGSEATFVNAQGLIQSTNEIGSELVTNGDFSNDTDWTNLGAWTISNGKANNNGSSSGDLKQVLPMSLNVGSFYIIQFTVSNYISGLFDVNIGGNVNTIDVSSDGIFEYTLELTSAPNNNILLRPRATFNGSIDNVSVKEYTTATNTPRLDYSTGSEAFLLEPQSTNLITQSELFSDSYWTKIGASVVGGFTSPSGGLNAFKLVEDTSTGEHRVKAIGVSIVADRYSFSVFVKPNGRNQIRISGANYFSGGTDAYFNLDTKVITYGTRAANGLIETFSNGWYRCSFSSTSGEVAGGNAFMYIDTALNGSASYTGDGTSGVYIYGAQLEQSSYATSPIPTSGATATRNQELCTNATPVINSEEGTLYAEISALANDGTYREISLNDGTTNNVVEIRYNNITNQLQFVVRNGGSVAVSSRITLTSALDFNKIAFSYKSNDYKMYVNGIEVGNATSGLMPSGLNALSFDWGGSNPFFGNTKGLKYYPKALADVQLEDLTTI